MSRLGKNIIDLSKFKTPLGEYIIGYTLGDGSVNKGDRFAHVTVGTIDYEIVDIFKEFFGDMLRVYETDAINNNKKFYTIRINSIQIVDYMISIGITPLKSKTCELKIPYTWDILRGYFDADGCIRKPNRRELKITSNSKKSLDQVLKFTKVGIIKKRNKELAYDWWVTKYDDLKYIFENMYYNNCHKLGRKFKNLSDHITYGDTKIASTVIELIKNDEILKFNSWKDAAKYFNVTSSALCNRYKDTGKFRGYDIKIIKPFRNKSI